MLSKAERHRAYFRVRVTELAKDLMRGIKKKEERRRMPNNLAWAIEWMSVPAIDWGGEGLAGVRGTDCRNLSEHMKFEMRIWCPSENVW